jgi:hypothetical protein
MSYSLEYKRSNSNSNNKNANNIQYKNANNK